jgi:hypothetical protein
MSDLRFKGIRIFDYARWAELLGSGSPKRRAVGRSGRAEHRASAQQQPSQESLVEGPRSAVRMRGWYASFRPWRPAPSKPWHGKPSGRTFLKPDTAKCLHYYFYLIDPDLGLCCLRVPSWAPFRLQFYFNGHAALEAALRKRQIETRMLENGFVHVADWLQAQRLADQLKPQLLHRKLDRYARQFCPPIALFDSGYHWSLMQVEYATDIVFRRQQELAPIYEALVRTAVHA